jgi:hypothetical protein
VDQFQQSVFAVGEPADVFVPFESTLNCVQAVSSFCMFPGTGTAVRVKDAGVPAGLTPDGAVAGLTAGI